MNLYTLWKPLYKWGLSSVFGPRMQFILKLNIIALLLSASVFPASASNLFAQAINLTLRDASLETALKEISNQSDYLVWYEEGLLRDASKVTLSANNMDIDEALKALFETQPLTYSIVGKTIVVEKKEVPVVSETSVQELITISGKVSVLIQGREESTPGVTIREKGGSRTATTNNNGDYSIRVPEGSVLVFTMLGYKDREVRVTENNASLNINLEADVRGLNDVVVTGYQTQERRTITGAMAQIKAAEFENMPIQSFDQAMQGRMAGVLVQGGAGTPGGPVKVEIRGTGSISAGTQPLYIVDGVEINSEDAATSTTAANPLAFLNPDDIESIEVLKDAAAASIYGAQAANGVILITTKGGEAGATRFSVNYYKGFLAPMPFSPMLNSQQYLNLRTEAIANLHPDWSTDEVRSTVLTENRFPLTMTDAEIANLPTYDWQDAIFRVGNTDNVQLVTSGGSGKTTFRFSSSFNKSQGNVIANDFTRATAYLRLNHDISDKFRLWASANLSHILRNGSYRSYGSYAYLSSPQHAAPLTLPFVPIYEADGSYHAPEEGFPGDRRYNTVQVSDYNTQLARTNNMFGNFRLTYDILDNLTWQSRFGLNYRIYDTEFYIDPRTQEGDSRLGYKSFRYQPSTTFTTSHTLVYDTNLPGGHAINALLGAEYRGYKQQRAGVYSEGFPSYQFRYVSSASTILEAYENGYGNKRAGVFGQVNYNYMKKYMLSAVLRRDGSSRFGKDNRWGWFPAISAGWDISQELFMRNTPWVQQLKLRASYGETGNSAIASYAAMALWDGSGSYGGEPGTKMTQMGNDELRWERNISTNVGVDFSLFNRKLYGAVDAFHRRSADLLIRTPIPWSSGFSSIYRNVGEVVNKGLEIELSSNIIESKNFQWSSSFNISFIKNRVTKLYKGIVEDGEDLDAPPVEEEVSALPGSPGIRLGWPLYTNFRSQYAGVNAATGKAMWWYGQNQLTYSPGTQGSGSYTPYGRGNRLSDYFGGFVNTFTYKRLELGVFFQYDMGRELYNSTNTWYYRMGKSQTNVTQRSYDLRWQQPGDITAFPRPIDGGIEELSVDHNLASTRFLEDASYIRLKQISLTYRIPQKFMDRLKLSSAEVYAQATNVFTWTKWTGYDPEFYIDDSNFTSNVGQIPQTRNYTLGFKLNF